MARTAKVMASRMMEELDDMRFMTDPRAFNMLIMSLYAVTAGWWAWHRRWADVLYWLFALGLTAVVTFGYRR